MRVSDAGNRVVIDVAVAGDDLFNARNAFLLGFVREHWTGVYVADCGKAGGACRDMFVHLEATALLGLDADFFEAELGCVWNASDSEKDAIGTQRFIALGF